MQTLSDCLPSNVSAPTYSPPSVETPRPLAPTPTRTLWLRMSEIYGHRWTAAYGENPDEGAGSTWAKGLAGLSTAQVAAGLGACIASADPWPPTLPEFRARCLSIPTLLAVRAELQDSGDRSGFAVLVWQRIDGFAYKQASADRADRILREAYDDARERVMRGERLPEPGLAITADKSEVKPASPEVETAAMASIAAELGVDRKTAAAGGDA